MKSEEIKPNDGRKNNKRKAPIPMSKVPQIERSNKPAMNTAKKSRKKQYAKKALKNVFGSEANFFEDIAKKVKKSGNYNLYKLLMDAVYDEETNVAPKTNNAPVIQFINNEAPKQIDEKTIDVEHKELGEDN
jgi:hypothetical protein